MPLPTELVLRFRHDYAALAGEPEKLGPEKLGPEKLGMAVSGGPDSLALLLLAHAAFPGQIEAATVDHSLRADSAGEAAEVAALCGRLGCHHAILKVAVPARGDGLQGEARRARYDALRGWAGERAIPILCTAHHADDQAETILMRLQRGAGVAGLSAIRAVRSEGATVRIVRPLLGWTRAELAAIVAASGLAAVDDPSNRDTRFDRVVMRDFLAANPQFAPARLARSAAACQEADAALDWAADQLAEDRITSQGGEWRVDPTGLPRELKRRLLARAIAAVREAHGIAPPWTGAEDVETLLVTLEAGNTGTLAEIMAKGGPAWHLRPAPPRRPARA